MVVKKTICWPNLGCALWHAVFRCRSHIHNDAGTDSSCRAMTQHYPTTSAAAAVWANGLSCPVSAIFFSFTHPPSFSSSAEALSKTLLFVLCFLQT